VKTHPESIFTRNDDLGDLDDCATSDLWVSREPIPGYDMTVEFVPASAYRELLERCENAEVSANGFESLYDAAYGELQSIKAKLENALELIGQYGGINGVHHKAWVIDQIVRMLTDDRYDDWVNEVKGPIDEDGETEYDWDIGIAP